MVSDVMDVKVVISGPYLVGIESKEDKRLRKVTIPPPREVVWYMEGLRSLVPRLELVYQAA